MVASCDAEEHDLASPHQIFGIYRENGLGLGRCFLFVCV